MFSSGGHIFVKNVPYNLPKTFIRYRRGRIIVSRNKMNRWVDIVLFATAVFQGVSGLILLYGLPHGPGTHGRFGGASYLGLVRGDWLTLHDWGALLLAVVAVLHTALHWKWIRYNIFGMKTSSA